jgi:hypothetical protein
MRWLGLGAGLLLVACGDGGGYVYMDDDLPSENCQDTDPSACATSSGGATTSTSTSTTGGVDGSTGGASGSCDELGCEAGFCVAPFDGEIGEFACVPDCIGIMDEALWCADASACCDAAAVCTDRGYCVPAGSGGSESGGSDGGESDSGGSESGGSSGG